MFILTLIVSLLLGLVFLGAGTAKLRSAEPVSSTLDNLGVGRGLRKVIGALEVLGAIGLAVGLWVEPLGFLAAVGLVLLMVGAIIHHVRARENVKQYAGAFVILAFAGVAAALQAASI